MVRRGLHFAILCALGLAPSLRAAESPPPIGLNVHAPEKEQLELLFDRAVEAGIGWVRVDFVWAVVEPEPGVERWRVYDEIVAAARARDLRVLALIAYTPAWATDGPEISGVPRQVSSWSDFCYRAASRYRDGITHWEVWNEPNLPGFWAGSRAAYIEKILLPAARALHAANPDARIGGPALAHYTGKGRDWHVWLLDVLRQAGTELDFLTHHAYDLEDPAGVLARIAGETRFGADPARWSEVAPSLREVVVQAEFDRPVWLTETGWVTTRLDEGRQAEHYRTFLELWSADGREPTWPAQVFFYELQDDPDPRFPKFGLLRPSGRRKPAYGVLRDFIGADAPPPDEDDPAAEPDGRRPKKPLPD